MTCVIYHTRKLIHYSLDLHREVEHTVYASHVIGLQWNIYAYSKQLYQIPYTCIYSSCKVFEYCYENDQTEEQSILTGSCLCTVRAKYGKRYGLDIIL